MYRRILVGYDGSDASQKALDQACALAAQHDAELHVITVARPPDIGDDVESEAIIESSREHHRRMLAALKPELKAKKIKSHLEVAVGHPAEQIIYYADKHAADLIVLGDRGHSRLRRLLLGSVTRQVTEHADRPVLVVR
jgi:nucleotide-binding universal stress UspA family protein